MKTLPFQRSVIVLSILCESMDVISRLTAWVSEYSSRRLLSATALLWKREGTRDVIFIRAKTSTCLLVLANE
jgi:hypothetical protein